MSTHLPTVRRSDRAAWGMRWLVVLVLMFGTVVSSVGWMNSHGIAAMAAAQHVTPADHDGGDDHAHGHTHEDDHPHHGADHSHDKAHALPAAWDTAMPPLAGWYGGVQSWVKTTPPYRLDRPPMG